MNSTIKELQGQLQRTQGWNDCKKGIPHEAGKGELYDEGYGARYAHEQSLDALTGFINKSRERNNER